MKKALCLTIIICMLTLSGCGALRANYRELEQMRVIQTMGVDRSGGGVLLTLATAAGDRSGQDAVCISAEGGSVSAALERAREQSVKEDLFCGHVRYFLIGQEVAEAGVEDLLAYICRSTEVRLDMPLYVLKGGSAQEAMSGVGSGTKGISEVLQAAQTKLDYRGDSRITTAGELIRGLERQGSALLCALEYRDAAEDPDSAAGSEGDNGGEAKTAAFAGFGILKDGRLCGWLGRDKAVGLGLLTNTLGVSDLAVRDRYGRRVTLELTQGSSTLRPLWGEDGGLQGLEIKATVRASVLETPEYGVPTEAAYADELTGQLESAVAAQLRAVLQQSKTLEVDFLGLGSRVEQAAPREYRRLEGDFAQLLPGLEISISVSGQLTHTNDRN